ncbi:MAG: hypothetical protein Q8869_03330, partial [Candidatus Phytoplasma australasiaticum]|nr:hypothetical protein [Candidatus Phytoplasma australasiaticum]
SITQEPSLHHPHTPADPATERPTHVACNKNKAVIFELNIKTDFAAQNIQFIELITTIEKILLQVPDSIRKLNDFLNYNFQGKTVKQIISQKMTIFQEQIRLKRIQIVYKKTEESFGAFGC